ncbi:MULTISPECIES: hypothetical protein [unclassified Campylobacter]|uniref:hypothetical protein n=1 Tax=unclassified Campylobacter TaxID=2593542 RepID=UPI0022E9FCFE|nr:MULTISPECIES: hypothetical protein [unclassified Campylobacter]MDA3061989.1 hypothetical protein [Campylobacter sp. JMF_14 EL1]MDA3072906.1 hypothetical protein [Campylobacter sp. JMF_10 EL2]
MEEKIFRSVRMRAMLNFGILYAVAGISTLIIDILKVDKADEFALLRVLSG